MTGYGFDLACPRVVAVELTGALPPWVEAKDVILELPRRVTVRGGRDAVFEFTGPAVAGLSVTSGPRSAGADGRAGARRRAFTRAAPALPAAYTAWSPRAGIVGLPDEEDRVRQLLHGGIDATSTTTTPDPSTAPARQELSTVCVIPTHRRPDRLRTAVTSALAQGCGVTVVVVDDADDPATRAVVADFDPERVRYVQNPGSGACSSRNHGVRCTRSDVVAFLDDDDVWDGDYLRTALRTLRRDGADVVFTQLAGAGRLPLRLDVGSCVAYNPGVTGSNVVLRRAAFERTGGFDESLWVSNDKDFLVRLLDLGLPYTTVVDPLVHYSHHDADRLTSPSPRRLDGLRNYYARYRSRLTPTQRIHLMAVIFSTSARVSRSRPSRLGRRALALLCFAATPGPSSRRLRSRRRRLPR